MRNVLIAPSLSFLVAVLVLVSPFSAQSDWRSDPSPRIQWEDNSPSFSERQAEQEHQYEDRKREREIIHLEERANFQKFHPGSRPAF